MGYTWHTDFVADTNKIGYTWHTDREADTNKKGYTWKQLEKWLRAEDSGEMLLETDASGGAKGLSV